MSKPVEELFKNAPEDATHYAKHCHYKVVGDTWMVHMHDNEWVTSDSMYNGQIKPSDIIARPTVKPWSGPEDGLPPSEWCSAGKMVQVMSLPTHHHEDVSIYLSKPSKIVASYTDDHGDTFLLLQIYVDGYGTCYECFAAHRVLPAKTENQIAADLRETAIRELMDIAQVDCRVTAARLVDAGFKGRGCDAFDLSLCRRRNGICAT